MLVDDAAKVMGYSAFEMRNDAKTYLFRGGNAKFTIVCVPRPLHDRIKYDIIGVQQKINMLKGVRIQ